VGSVQALEHLHVLVSAALEPVLHRWWGDCAASSSASQDRWAGSQTRSLGIWPHFSDYWAHTSQAESDQLPSEEGAIAPGCQRRD
jgi:hypothetical protein